MLTRGPLLWLRNAGTSTGSTSRSGNRSARQRARGQHRPHMGRTHSADVESIGLPHRDSQSQNGSNRSNVDVQSPTLPACGPTYTAIALPRKR